MSVLGALVLLLLATPFPAGLVALVFGLLAVFSERTKRLVAVPAVVCGLAVGGLVFISSRGGLMVDLNMGGGTNYMFADRYGRNETSIAFFVLNLLVLGVGCYLTSRLTWPRHRVIALLCAAASALLCGVALLIAIASTRSHERTALSIARTPEPGACSLGVTCTCQSGLALAELTGRAVH